MLTAWTKAHFSSIFVTFGDFWRNSEGTRTWNCRLWEPVSHHCTSVSDSCSQAHYLLLNAWHKLNASHSLLPSQTLRVSVHYACFCTPVSGSASETETSSCLPRNQSSPRCTAQSVSMGYFRKRRVLFHLRAIASRCLSRGPPVSPLAPGTACPGQPRW